MGARGPKAKPPTTVSTTLRLDAGVRDKVEAAARKNRKSMAYEIETRLDQSFTDEFAVADQFGDRQLQAVARMAFAAARATVNVNQGARKSGNNPAWLDDPAAFDAAVAAINKVFALIRPGGAGATDQPAGVTYRPAPAADQPGGVSYQPTFNAEELVREIAMAPLVAPARASRHVLATVALRKDLGDAVLNRAGGAQARDRSAWAKEYGALRRKQDRMPASMTNEELRRMRALEAERERLLR
jgi:Arc-like DNA binding domain